MADLFTPDELKAQLNVTDDGDDTLLGRLTKAVRAYLESQLGFLIDEKWPPTGDDDAEVTSAPEDLRQGALMLAAHWYENREASLVGLTLQSLPMGFDEIIANYRNYTFGVGDDG